jgi:cytochrome c6
MKQLAIVFAVLFAAGTALAQTPAQTPTQLYQSNCALCHGKAGKPTPIGRRMGATSLTTLKASTAAMVNVITHGQKRMPAFKNRLTKEQIDALAAYIKSGLK